MEKDKLFVDLDARFLDGGVDDLDRSVVSQVDLDKAVVTLVGDELCTGVPRGTPPRASQLIDWAQQGETGTVQIGVARNPPLGARFRSVTQTLSP